VSGRKHAQATARMSLLLAIALILGYVEHLLPAATSVPGVKLGLANVVLLYAVYLMDARRAFALMLAKAALSGLLFAGASAMMYALAGGVISLAAMLAVRRVRGVSVVGVSAVGAAFHNIGQIGLAVLVVKTPALLGYLPVLLVSGAITGIATGVIAKLVMRHVGDGGWD